MSDLFTALKGMQMVFQLALTFPAPDVSAVIAGLAAVDTSRTLAGMYSICDHLPGVLNRRWGSGSDEVSEVFSRAVDQLYMKRSCVMFPMDAMSPMRVAWMTAVIRSILFQ